ncbi:MAG TPA: hypothetical protein VFW23_01095, partial [Tepidisphaeraceae bacterium]|nr:hypothetical protein [Tepidisphaeraceae bacterium]
MRATHRAGCFLLPVFFIDDLDLRGTSNEHADHGGQNDQYDFKPALEHVVLSQASLPAISYAPNQNPRA